MLPVPARGPDSEFPKWDYSEYPRTLPRDDFWGQVRRTVHGRRATEQEVAVIVRQIQAELQLCPTDVLLELGCGNGALSARLFDECGGYAGADLSTYLIGVAKEFFERAPDYLFFESDALAFAADVGDPDRFTKGLCFALFQYLSPESVKAVLSVLWERFPRLNRVVIGNLPDRDRAHLFFDAGYRPEDLDQHKSQIGRWWSQDELRIAVNDIGWTLAVPRRSSETMSGSYRFDAVLTRGPNRK